MRIRRRYGRRLAAMGTAAAVTVLLAQNTTTASFAGQTSDTGNQVSSALTFCTTPNTRTLSPTADTAAYQSAPNSKYGTATGIGVGVGTTTSMNAYTFIAFSVATQQPLPARCKVTGATLRFFASTPMTGATIDAYRADAAWDASTLTWNTGMPGFITATKATSTSLTTGTTGWQEWDVTALTKQLYTGPDYGFALRDSATSAGSARYQTWDSMESTTAIQRPELRLSWG
jgi:hypothetical protein